MLGLPVSKHSTDYRSTLETKRVLYVKLYISTYKTVEFRCYTNLTSIYRMHDHWRFTNIP